MATPSKHRKSSEREAFRCHRTVNTLTLIHDAYIETVSPESLHGMLESMQTKEDNNTPVVGRGAVRILPLREGEQAVARRCLRGGVMQKLLRDNFCCLPRGHFSHIRPVNELRILEHLSERGASVPSPVASHVVFSGLGFLYQGLLVTKQIRDADNLLLFALRRNTLRQLDQQVLQDLCLRAGAEAARILTHGVMHADLHPGNVLFQGGSKVFIIDFDKAYFLAPRANLLRYAEQLHRRWMRSVRKHGLEEGCADAFLKGLKSVLTGRMP